MFTGIIEDIGRVVNIVKRDKFIAVSIKGNRCTEELFKGDSISVDGVCLTVTGFVNNSFLVDISPETMRKTTLSRLHAGDSVNLERAVTPHKRLGGHIVSGHIDGVGMITKKKREGEGYFFSIKTDEDILRFIIKNGSVAVDGISLTAVDLWSENFSLMIIPHTLSNTTLISKREGDLVNIECDIIGKYVEKLLDRDSMSEKRSITYGFLAEHGFV